MSLIFSHR